MLRETWIEARISCGEIDLAAKSHYALTSAEGRFRNGEIHLRLRVGRAVK